MGFSLLAPLFLAGLAALAVPVYVHLTDRDRRDVVRFPSLRFLTRLPYRQMRRQRLRHWWLFALRALAVVLLVLAFCRPLFDAVAAAAGSGVGGEIVIAIDRSYSMSYGDGWERALDAARGVLDAAPPDARVALVTFDETAAVRLAPTTDHAAVADALAALEPGAAGTSYAPLLRLVNEILAESPSADRELVLVSDFQARAWERGRRAALMAGARLVPVDVSAGEPANVMIADVKVRRSQSDGRPSMTLTVRVVNHGPGAVARLPVVVAADAAGGAVEMAAGYGDLPPAGSAMLELGPIDPPAALTRVTVRIDADALAADDAFYLTISPRPALPVLVIEAPDARSDASLFLRQALAVAEEPSFDAVVRSADRVTPADVEGASVVVLHDSPLPRGDVGRAIAERIAAGGGLWIVLGRRSAAWNDERTAALLPGSWRETVDRLDVQGVGLASVDYDHPIFEIFTGSKGGNVGGARIYRYRPIVVTEAGTAASGGDTGGGGEIVAGYTDGAVALAERRVGDGRVLLWGSPLDNRWSDLPVQSIFLPFVHQVCRWLSGEQVVDPWHQVGQALDVRALVGQLTGEPGTGGAIVLIAPSGRRLTVEPDRSTSPPLDEAGFYQVALPATGELHPVAVNVDRAESDLARLDVEAFVAASTSQGDPAAAAAPVATRQLSREERERRQGVWWYLVLGALLLLGAESVLSNRIRQAASPAGRGHEAVA